MNTIRHISDLTVNIMALYMVDTFILQQINTGKGYIKKTQVKLKTATLDIGIRNIWKPS